MKIRFLLAAVLFILFITASYLSSSMSRESILLFSGFNFTLAIVFSLCLYPWMNCLRKEKLLKAISYGALVIPSTFLFGYVSAVLIASYL